jgi:hypothetical protein
MKTAMKKFLCVCIVIAAMTACEKTPPVVTPPPVTAPENRVSRMEKDGTIYTVSYNNSGRIDQVVLKQGTGTSLNTYQFVYSGTQLDEVRFSFGGKWKYYYNNNKLMRIETINDLGQTRYRKDFDYGTDGRVTEYYEYLISAAGTVSPQYKILFTYDNRGNITQMAIYYFINKEWDAQETVYLSGYDNHPNTTRNLEVFPFLPEGVFTGNNHAKEEYRDSKSGVVTNITTYSYLYDNTGRPLTRNGTTVSPGFPDTFSSLQVTYQ